jgi:hypothetical protein
VSYWLARPLFGEAVHGLSESLGIGVGGIEAASNPLEPFVVLLMAGIGDGIEELAVTPWATNILRRTASGCFDKARVVDAWHGISDALDTDRVLPAIAEVVEVFQRFGADILQNIDEPGLAGIERSVTEVRIRPAPRDATGVESNGMIGCPCWGSRLMASALSLRPHDSP